MLRNMLAPTLAVGLFLAPASPLSAEKPEDCAPIANRYERLDCYDGFFVTDDIEMSVLSDWTVQQRASSFGDNRTIFMWVPAKEPLVCPESEEPSPLRLYLRCRDGRTTLYIHTGCVLSGAYGHGRVDMRVDDGRPFTVNLGESADNSALGLWSSERSIPVITRMMGGERLFARVKPFNGAAVTTEFNIGGLATASRSLRQACRW